MSDYYESDASEQDSILDNDDINDNIDDKLKDDFENLSDDELIDSTDDSDVDSNYDSGEEKEKLDDEELESDNDLDEELDEEDKIKEKIKIPPNITYSHYMDKMSKKNRVPNDKRKSRPILTKYEYTKLVGFRSQQIAEGVKPKIDVGDLTDPYEIAKKEVEQKKVPFLIRRPINGNIYEEWSLKELHILIH